MLESAVVGSERTMLAVPDERIEALFLGGGGPDAALDGIVDYWLIRGVIDRGAVFLRRVGRWELLTRHPAGFRWSHADSTEEEATDAAVAPPEEAHALSRILALPNLHGDPSDPTGRPLPHFDGDLVAYSLASHEEEHGRLILRPKGFLAPDTHVQPSLYLALTLLLRAMRASSHSHLRELQGHLRRRLFQDGAGSLPDGASLSAGFMTAWRRDFPEILGRSRRLGEILEVIRRAASQDVTVLIQGESGVGKELVARAIHRLSHRRNGPFVGENCAAFPETLIEAELFGNEKGAYTGADRARAGLLERASGGTLFLDEIGELPATMQSKLLRVLQEREVRRVGGDRSIPTDFRLLTATHRDLEEDVRAGRFRQDLFFRVQVVTVRVPPLRERRDDIPVLVRQFIKILAKRRGISPPEVDGAALTVLCNYEWPGNVRELQNELERAMTLSPELISPESLSTRFHRPFLQYSLTRRVREELGTNLDGLEKMLLGGVIRDVLEEAGGNKTHAARLLGIAKASLYRRLTKYGIKAQASGAPGG